MTADRRNDSSIRRPAPIYLRALTKERTSSSFSLPGRTKRPRNGINPRRTDNPDRQSFDRFSQTRCRSTNLSIVAANSNFGINESNIHFAKQWVTVLQVTRWSYATQPPAGGRKLIGEGLFSSRRSKSAILHSLRDSTNRNSDCHCVLQQRGKSLDNSARKQVKQNNGKDRGMTRSSKILLRNWCFQYSFRH